MPTNHTPHYNLSQWERDDRILMDDFNADNAKIDTALKALAGTLDRKGNCQLYVTSYAGNGLTGPANARSLSFPKQPRIVFIAGNRGFLLLVPGVNQAVSVSGSNTLTVDVSWGGSSVSWYGGSEGWVMMNASGTTYQVVALLQS